VRSRPHSPRVLPPFPSHRASTSAPPQNRIVS
jgi:hypothetical protein